MEHTGEHAAVVVADDRTELSRLLVRAYVECLPEARVISFDQVAHEAVKAAFAELGESALVVLIQSTYFGFRSSASAWSFTEKASRCRAFQSGSNGGR